MQSQGDDFDIEGAQALEEGNESNAALLQLQDAFVSALTSSGALGKIRAELRATALSLLRGDEELQRAAVGDVLKPTSLSTTSKVALLLLYDFLQYHQLRQTAGVLEVEGSVHLLSSEQDALLSDMRALPGDGPLLERLVEFFGRNPMGVPLAAVVSPTGEVVRTLISEEPRAEVTRDASSPASNSLSSSLKKIATTTVVLPENEDVRREYDVYEPSIAFSDVDGALDDGEHQYDEVEEI
jgi:hypothetical protein